MFDSQFYFSSLVVLYKNKIKVANAAKLSLTFDGSNDLGLLLCLLIIGSIEWNQNGFVIVSIKNFIYKYVHDCPFIFPTTVLSETDCTSVVSYIIFDYDCQLVMVQNYFLVFNAPLTGRVQNSGLGTD